MTSPHFSSSKSLSFSEAIRSRTSYRSSSRYFLSSYNLIIHQTQFYNTLPYWEPPWMASAKQAELSQKRHLIVCMVQSLPPILEGPSWTTWAFSHLPWQRIWFYLYWFKLWHHFFLEQCCPIEMSTMILFLKYICTVQYGSL